MICLMLSHGQIDFVGITQGQSPIFPVSGTPGAGSPAR